MRIEDLPADFLAYRHDVTYFNLWLKQLAEDPSMIEEYDEYRENWSSPPCLINGGKRSMKLGLWINSPDSGIPSITRFLTSPLARSRHAAGMVAMAIADYGEEPLIEECALACERDYGTINSIKNKTDLLCYLESLEARKTDPVGYCMFGAETLIKLYQRAESYLRFVQPRERTNSERHLLSTHSSFMWALRGVIEGIEPEKLAKMMADPEQYIGFGDAVQYKRQPGGVLLRRICSVEKLPKRYEGWEDVTPLRTHYQFLSQVGRLLPTSPVPDEGEQ